MIRRRRSLELDRYELRRLHEEAISIRARWPEFFPGVKRPSSCPIDDRSVTAPPGTLAAFMQANIT